MGCSTLFRVDLVFDHTRGRRGLTFVRPRQPRAVTSYPFGISNRRNSHRSSANATCRLNTVTRDRFGGAVSGVSAIGASHCQPGATPQDWKSPMKPRAEGPKHLCATGRMGGCMERAFSPSRFGQLNPGALPQAGNESWPLALQQLTDVGQPRGAVPMAGGRCPARKPSDAGRTRPEQEPIRELPLSCLE